MNIIRQEKSECGFPYISYVPDSCGNHPAMLIQLHGAGERGQGGVDLDRVLIHGFSKIVNDQNLKDCILLMPQCPEDSFWVAKIESLKKFIDAMISKFSVDSTRVYLCGLSMGGFGTWYTAMAYPHMFAAIAPCCGGGMAWNAPVLNMPVWAFHGLEDTCVSPNQTREMVDALKPINKNLKYDFYDGIGHDSWNMAFGECTLAWLLSNKKTSDY